MRKGSWELAGRVAALALAAALCGLGQAAVASQVYTWTDENGVTHFSDREPPDAETEVIDMEDKPGGVTYSKPEDPGDEADPNAEAEPSLGQQRREAIAADNAQRRADRAERATVCDRQRDLLARLEPARRAYYTDESGQEVRMDDAQRVQAIADTRAYIEQYCD